MVSDYRAFHCTVIGASHVRAGSVCQDCSQSRDLSNGRALVVCDGHGGADYVRADRGSRFAAEAFLHCAEEPAVAAALAAAATDKQCRARIGQFVKSVIARWNGLVERDVREHPFTAEELETVSERARRRYEAGERLQAAYGTTLIGVLLTADFWMGVQIGDGKCVAVSDDGVFTQPIPWDEACFLNVTTSLCDADAAAEFRFCFSRTLPVAVFIGSDGIDDCFAGDERLYDFYRVVLRSFAQEEPEGAFAQLADYLPELSAKGSGDDMSVGLLLHTDFVRRHPERFAKAEGEVTS